MWDLWRHFTRGSISWRRFSLLATSMMMAIFVVIATFTQTAYAADVTRAKDASTVRYEGDDYRRIDKDSFKTDKKTKDLPIVSSGAFDGYQFVDKDNNLHLILTDDDASKATSGKAVTYSFKDGVYDPSSQSEIKNVSIETGDVNVAGECTLMQVGWFVCPLMVFLADRMDSLMNVLSNLLTVRTLQTNTTDNPIYEIWEKVRDIANICFIIAFLIIVYSQVTNLGLSNYGLKVMLPRLIVAAILVNSSYWIASLAVDTSNLLGLNIQHIFTSVREGLSGYDKIGTDLGWSKLTGVVLAGGGLLGAVVIANGGIAASLTLLIPALVGVLLAAFVALVILAARQALITLCILIAPLAFVAYILPSTNKYFDKWKDLFLTMLLMFPIISFVFGAAQLAGYAIIVNAGDSPIQIIIGLTVQVAPIAITPFLIRISGNVLGKIGGIVNDPSRGLVDRTRNWAQDRAKYQAAKNRAGVPLIDKKNGRLTNNFLTRRSTKLKKAAERTADGLNRAHTSKLNPNSHMNNAIRRQHRKKTRQQALTAAYESMATNNATAWDNETFGSSSAHSIEGNETARKSEIDNAFYATRHGQNLERRTRSAAIHKTELDNAFDRANHDLTARQHYADIDKTRVTNEFNDSVLGSQVDRARRLVEANKTRIEHNQQAAWDHGAAGSDRQIMQATLETKSSEIKADKAKQRLEKMQTEIVAQGADSEHVINLRGATPATQTHILQIARDIKSDSLEASVIATAKAQAERQIVENKAKALDENLIRISDTPGGPTKTIVEYAGGIKGVVGERSVVAQAKTERSKFIIDDAKNIEATLNYEVSSNPQALFTLFQNAQTDSERVAYTSIMGKRGGPGATNLRKMVTIMDERLAAGEITRDDLNGYKELVLAQNSNIPKLGKDLEFYFTNAAYGTDDAHPDYAGNVKTFTDISNSVSTWGNLSANAFSSMNIVNQMHGLRILAHKSPAKYERLVANLKASPTIMANMKDAVVEAIDRAPDDPRWFTGADAVSQDELTDFERHVLSEPRITDFRQRDGYDEEAAYWKDKYDKLYANTERMFDDLASRGIADPNQQGRTVDYRTAPEHKPKK